MKMFKKLMAVALTAVMAVSMLTGCAMNDAAKQNALINALNSDSVKSDYEGAAKHAWKNELGEGKTVVPGKVTKVEYKEKNYVCYVVKTPDSAKKAVNWAADAKFIDQVMSVSAEKTGDKKDKIKIDVTFESYKAQGDEKSTHYAIVIAKAAV